MTTLRVVHYLNQFFAGIGSEDKADTPPGRREGPTGPGRLLQQSLGDRAQVVATVYCGDNHVGEKAGAVEDVVSLIAEAQPDIVIAGPAFSAGRYGLACGAVAASTSPSRQPPPACTSLRSGSTVTSRSPDRSMVRPPSDMALPATLWPPQRTEGGRPCSRATLTAATTSSVVKGIFFVIVMDGVFAIFFASIGM